MAPLCRKPPRRPQEINALPQLKAAFLSRLAFVLLLPALVLVAWGELSKNAAAAEAVFWDKALHFFAYFGLSGMAFLALKGGSKVPAALLSLAVFGGVMELLQGLTGRDPDFYDEIANCAGILAGALTGYVILRLTKAKPLAPGRDR